MAWSVAWSDGVRLVGSMVDGGFGVFAGEAGEGAFSVAAEEVSGSAVDDAFAEDPAGVAGIGVVPFGVENLVEFDGVCEESQYDFVGFV